MTVLWFFCSLQGDLWQQIARVAVGLQSYPHLAQNKPYWIHWDRPLRIGIFMGMLRNFKTLARWFRRTLAAFKSLCKQVHDTLSLKSLPWHRYHKINGRIDNIYFWIILYCYVLEHIWNFKSANIFLVIYNLYHMYFCSSFALSHITFELGKTIVILFCNTERKSSTRRTEIKRKCIFFEWFTVALNPNKLLRLLYSWVHWDVRQWPLLWIVRLHWWITYCFWLTYTRDIGIFSSFLFLSSSF